MRLALLLLVTGACAHLGGQNCSAVRTCPWTDLVEASQCGGDDGSITYRAPEAEEQAADARLFAGVLAASPQGAAAVETLRPEAERLGFDLTICEDTAVLTEKPALRRGGGAYVVRLGAAAAEMLVQIPHSFSDLHTLPLGRELFSAAGARALAVSTMHRRGESGFDTGAHGPPPKGHADVAHDASSTFQAMTMAWMSVLPAGLVVQLHGFADVRTDADIVLSAGVETPAAAWLKAIRRTLGDALSGRVVAAFPDDVDDLGATTNVQGQAVRAAAGRFLHVEMSASLRESLRRRRSDRARFARILADALGRKLETAAKAR